MFFSPKVRATTWGEKLVYVEKKKPGVLISENNPEGWASVQEQ